MRVFISGAVLVAAFFCVVVPPFAGAGSSDDTKVDASAPKPKVLTLDEAVSIALRQNPDLLLAIHEIERTRGLIIEVRAQALPRIEATANYQGEGERTFFSGADQTTTENSTFQSVVRSPADRSYQIGIGVRQLIYSGGQVDAALKIAGFSRESAYFALRDTIDQVIESVRSQFYEALLNRQLIDVEQETLLLLQEELEDQQNRFDAGTVPRFNVLRAEVELANQRPALFTARNNYRIAQYQLAKTLGINYQPLLGEKLPFALEGELPYTPRALTLQDAVKAALERRPFLAVQRLSILQEEQQIRVARGSRLPRVSLASGYSVQNDRAAGSGTEPIDNWYAGVEGSWAVFDGFEAKGKVIQAKARLESAKTIFEDSVRQVELEVQQAFSRLRESEALIASQQKNVEQAQEALRLARERLDAGAGTQLEVLDARTALTRSQTTEVQARYQYNLAAANLDRVTATDTVYDDNLPPSIPSAPPVKTKKVSARKR